jgi:hypothetical protein
MRRGTGRGHRRRGILAARETAKLRADPAIAGGELALAEHGEPAGQRDAVANEAQLHRRTHPRSALDIGIAEPSP